MVEPHWDRAVTQVWSIVNHDARLFSGVMPE
jgi:hypothetical protein